MGTQAAEGWGDPANVPGHGHWWGPWSTEKMQAGKEPGEFQKGGWKAPWSLGRERTPGGDRPQPPPTHRDGPLTGTEVLTEMQRGTGDRGLCSPKPERYRKVTRTAGVLPATLDGALHTLVPRLGNQRGRWGRVSETEDRQSR